ncbi:MAG TPA: hypothetical protein VHV81_02855 [Steroidobacteraceae bacterium]|jgi:hypothetical protein|nr:hypothetical protein [Steroidobacteraceae bacterium]
MISLRALALCTCGLGLAVAPAAAGDDDHDAAKPGPNAPLALNAEQQRAVGIAVAHPVAAQAPERIDALGEVLDPTLLITESGESAAAAAAERSASTEAARLRALYQGGAGASLKMLEAADADQARAHATAAGAAARFALHWGPLAGMPAGERQQLIERTGAGGALLVRADLPGHHSLAALPDRALLDVDGLRVPGRVLGALRQASEVQSAGLLIEVSKAPEGLGAGAKVPVELVGAGHRGMALPRDAVLYDDGGPYVFKQLGRGADPKTARYAPVKVKLLARYGNGWLVDGIDDDDDIVVRGAGVLWSLQGMGSRPADADDDDD